jgi:hypothetical protein
MRDPFYFHVIAACDILGHLRRRNRQTRFRGAIPIGMAWDMARNELASPRVQTDSAMTGRARSRQRTLAALLKLTLTSRAQVTRPFLAAIIIQGAKGVTAGSVPKGSV